MQVKNIAIRKIFDTRADETIEVELTDYKKRIARACLPCGKSKSKKETVTFPFKEIQKKGYWKKINIITKKKFYRVTDFDNFLITLDGTKNKKKLGGNVTLGLSLAFARLLAQEKKLTLSHLVESEFFPINKNKPWNPVLFSNFINGGAHSDSNLNIQEYLVLAPIEGNALPTIEKLIFLYKETGTYLTAKFKQKLLPLGAENGYALNFKNNLIPLLVLAQLIKKNNFTNFALGIDVAGNNFFNHPFYHWENKKISKDELLQIYLKYLLQVPLLESIEDPFEENDVLDFQKLKNSTSKIIIGDDLTATNINYVKKYKDAISGVIIKPNQVGTITEAMEVCHFALKNNIRLIFSHRSGETEDNFIVELAYAARAFGIKIGAPLKDRIAKFNEVLRLLNHNFSL